MNQEASETTTTINANSITYHYVIKLPRSSLPSTMGSLLRGLFQGNGAPITITKAIPLYGKVTVTVNNSCVTCINGYTAKLDLECFNYMWPPMNHIITRLIVEADWDKQDEILHVKSLFNETMAKEQNLLEDEDLKSWEDRVWHFLDDLVYRMR